MSPIGSLGAILDGGGTATPCTTPLGLLKAMQRGGGQTTVSPDGKVVTITPGARLAFETPTWIFRPGRRLVFALPARAPAQLPARQPGPRERRPRRSRRTTRAASGRAPPDPGSDESHSRSRARARRLGVHARRACELCGVVLWPGELEPHQVLVHGMEWWR